MKNTARRLIGLALGLAVAGSAHAAVINITGDIDVSTTWTNNNTYNLGSAQRYVKNGATLTIEPGTVIATTAAVPPAGSGSLAVVRGSKIMVNGTEADPVIMTSLADVATWDPDAGHPTGANPKTGTWREAANEWGNLTLMGRAFISGSHAGGLPVPGNTKTPTGLNVRQMEGLVAAAPGDPNVLYGGNDDADDSGHIHYLSIRYGGKVIGLNNELNGLSLGGIGRETEIDHVEIMNNVDDGIEVWGGTVNLKYLNVWNIGDDSFDFDQGWRGKAQFGLAVQGYSLNAGQGSGVGDNVFEYDGAEDSDAQPVTTASVYNFTLIGQPVHGDRQFAPRDGARIQHRNYVVMDGGEQVIGIDTSGCPAGQTPCDGDGARGYGEGGTLSLAATFTTAHTESHNLATTVNACDDIPGGCGQGGILNNPADLYKSQVDGNLHEVKGAVFFNNANAAAYTNTDAFGVTIAGDDNPALDNVVAAASPIVSITRGPNVVKGGLTMQPVIDLDPRAANDALSVPDMIAPEDGFFTAAPYHGAFSGDVNWLASWTAADAFNMTTVSGNPADPNDTAIQLTATTLFSTLSGVLYTVEESSNGTDWSPIGTLVGNGGLMSVTDLDAFDSAKQYRVIAQ